MCFEIAGLQFPAAPFSGWYSLPEVATRDFLDKQRYNLSETIGEALGLNMSSQASLWMDRVNTELNVAVMQSFADDGVTMVDHHTQAEQFLDHFRTEHKLRGGCPADWVWIVPPESGSLTSVFHQEMLSYHLTPSYDYQTELHKNYIFPEDLAADGSQVKRSFRAVALAVRFAAAGYKKILEKRKKVGSLQLI
jgi:nitric oxide synthase oxygenase domain/subunit